MYENLNNGERLYQRSRVKQDQKLRKAQKKKVKAQESVFAKYTEKPTINKYSQGLKRSYKTPLENDLIQTGIEVDQKRYHEKIKKDSQEISQLPFHPDINDTSRSIGEQMLRVEGKEGVDNIHQILYLNAFVRKEQKNQIANEVNTQMANTLFKPQLVSKQMEGKRTLQDILNATEEQEEHLKAYQKAVSHHMKHTMFKPKTGRPPKDRNTNSEDIFNYLISMGTKYSKKKEQN